MHNDVFKLQPKCEPFHDFEYLEEIVTVCNFTNLSLIFFHLLSLNSGESVEFTAISNIIQIIT